MIGLWAAVLLFGAAVYLAVDAVYAGSGEHSAERRPTMRLRRLRRILAEADLEISPRLLVLSSGAGSVVLFAVVYQAMGWIAPSLLAAAAAAAAPFVYVWWRREDRLAAKEEALLTALDHVQEELRNLTIQEALVGLQHTAPPDIQPVFQRLAADLAQQRDYAEALRASKVRLGSQVWDDCVAGLLLAHAVGERNIRETFRRIASNARAQVQLRHRVHAQQAEQITGARITLIVPIAVVLFMRVSYPAADQFYTSPPGEFLLLGCGLAMLAGYCWMLKIGRMGRPTRVEEEA